MVHKRWMAQWKWHNTSFNVLFSSSPVDYSGPLRVHTASLLALVPSPSCHPPLFSLALVFFFMLLLHCSLWITRLVSIQGNYKKDKHFAPLWRFIAAQCNCTHVDSQWFVRRVVCFCYSALIAPQTFHLCLCTVHHKFSNVTMETLLRELALRLLLDQNKLFFYFFFFSPSIFFCFFNRSLQKNTHSSDHTSKWVVTMVKVYIMWHSIVLKITRTSPAKSTRGENLNCRFI